MATDAGLPPTMVSPMVGVLGQVTGDRVVIEEAVFGLWVGGGLGEDHPGNAKRPVIGVRVEFEDTRELLWRWRSDLAGSILAPLPRP